MVKRLGISIFFLISVVVLIYGVQTSNQEVIQFADSIKNHPLKVPTFMIWSMVVCFFNIPLGGITNLLSGWLFGFILGFLMTYSTLLIGSYLAFRFSRFLGKDLLEKYFGNGMSKLNSRLSQTEIISLVQFRIFPLVPLSVANLSLGITSVSDRNFIVSCMIGILPASLFYTYVGSKISELASEDLQFGHFKPFYIYFFSALVASILVPYLYKKFNK